MKVDVNELNLYTFAAATLKDVADADALWVSVRVTGRRECAVPCITALEHVHGVAA